MGLTKSMTGYGRGECLAHNRRIIIEIKSVNHRYNDINIRLPRIMNPIEDELRKRVSRRVFRGKTDVYIQLESYSKEDAQVSLNEALADAYAAGLQKIRSRYNLTEDISPGLIAQFPDVLIPERDSKSAEALAQIQQTAEEALDAALEQFIGMRRREGDFLRRDILEKLAGLEESLEQVKTRMPLAAGEYLKKLRQRMDEILGQNTVDETRALQEAALFADKACADEEIIRLGSHINQTREVFGQTEAVGKKLDFLAQEMNREINTIGSKANDAAITRLVLDMKSSLEKIREQIQNIE